MSRRGWVLFLAMAVIWGIPYLLIRVAVRQLDPGVLVFSRTAPVAVLLLPLVVARGQLSMLLRNFKWIATFAVIEFGVPWFFMATAERHITSSLTSLLICCVPLFAVVAHRLAGRHEQVSRRRYFGLTVGALGVLMLVGLDLSGGSLTWIGMMLIVCLGYTIGPMILAHKLDHVPGVAVVAGATAIVAVGWTPWTVVHWPAHVSAETINSVLVLSIVCTAGAFLVFFQLVKEVGSTRSVVVTYVNTGIAVVLGVLGLNEPLTIGIAIGFPLVLIGSIYATSGVTPDDVVYAENSAAT
ncbi:MAG TPA: DMT family transporter [Acidimicrobiales bacterium]|nr:DMT family transporter [Acidimicrobiales bacterium]